LCIYICRYAPSYKYRKPSGDLLDTSMAILQICHVEAISNTCITSAVVPSHNDELSSRSLASGQARANLSLFAGKHCRVNYSKIRNSARPQKLHFRGLCRFRGIFGLEGASRSYVLLPLPFDSRTPSHSSALFPDLSASKPTAVEVQEINTTNFHRSFRASINCDDCGKHACRMYATTACDDGNETCSRGCQETWCEQGDTTDKDFSDRR
ncbi:hypothetical protein KCU91_g156, partial [Aureobasidium melanogenum]